MNHSGSSVVRRQLGRRLRQQREKAGRTIRSVQDAKLFSESKVARIEAGKVPVRVGDVWTLCRFYNADKEVTDALAALSDGTTGDGWWEDYATAVPGWFGLYLGLEETCNVLSTYHPELVHGVLQTEAYAREVIQTDGPADEDVVIGRLKVRMDRKRVVLEQGNSSLHVVLGAGALSLTIGSPEVMREQVSYLRKLDSQPGIDVRVLPWSAGAHPGITGPFTLMDFHNPDDPSVVYLESMLGARYLEQEHQVETYRRTFTTLYQQAISIKEYTS